MPKINEPKIRLVLRTEKKNKDGLFPIYLRVNYRGMVERSTGYSCDAEHWDASGERVLRGFPNYRSINDSLSLIKASAINEVQRQKINGKGYNLQQVVAPEPLSNARLDGGKADTLSGLVDNYIGSHSLKKNTLSCWRQLKNQLVEWFDDRVDKWDIDVYIKRCAEKNLSDSTMSMLMGKVHALGLEMKNIDTRRWRCKAREKYIDKRAMRFIADRLLHMVTDFNEQGTMHTFKDEFIYAFTRQRGVGDILSLHYFYLLYLTALAPIDLALLQKSNIEVRTIAGNDYYIIKGKRNKTGVEFTISIRKTMETSVIIGGTLMFNPGPFFLPICNGLDVRNVDACNQRQRNIFNRYSKYLKEHFRAVNKCIAEYNAMHDDFIPVIDMDCTFYTARHSRATMIYNSPDATLGMLTTFLGRSVHGISVYLKQLQSESDLASMGNVIDV